MELLADKTKEEIATIWTQHFASKDAVCAIIPYETFKKMKELYDIHKTVSLLFVYFMYSFQLLFHIWQFLFPLPRKEGYEFVVVQFSGNEAHFTSLINFQAYHENAPECLTLVHYLDLAESKDIVLMVGHFDKNMLVSCNLFHWSFSRPNSLFSKTYDQAESLIVQTLQFYSKRYPKKTVLLERFTFNTDDFNAMDLVADFEATSLARGLAWPFLKNL